MHESQSPALSVISQKKGVLPKWTDERGQSIEVVMLLASDGKVYLPFTFFCRVLGISDAIGARKRAYKHVIIRKRLVQLPYDSDGGRQVAWCLERGMVGFWLGTLYIDKLRPEVQDSLLDFQEQLAILANNLWNGEVSDEASHALANVTDLVAYKAFVDAFAWIILLEQRIGAIENIVMRPQRENEQETHDSGEDE